MLIADEQLNHLVSLILLWLLMLSTKKSHNFRTEIDIVFKSTLGLHGIEVAEVSCLVRFNVASFGIDDCLHPSSKASFKILL